MAKPKRAILYDPSSLEVATIHRVPPGHRLSIQVDCGHWIGPDVGNEMLCTLCGETKGNGASDRKVKMGCGCSVYPENENCSNCQDHDNCHDDCHDDCYGPDTPHETCEEQVYANLKCDCGKDGGTPGEKVTATCRKCAMKRALEGVGV